MRINVLTDAVVSSSTPQIIQEVSQEAIQIMAKLKRLLIRIYSEHYRKRHNIRWSDSSLLHTAIECWSGYTEDDWTQTLDNDFSQWRRFIEVHFIHNRFERYALAPEMNLYASTWLTADLLRLAPQLKWVQLLTTGVEFLEGMDITPQLKITTISGVASSGVAEHVIGLMIALDRRFDLAFLRQQRWKWRQGGIVEHIRGVRGRTVGIIGLGNIGRSVAILAKSMGLEVLGMSRSRHQEIGEINDWYGQDDLIPLLNRADFAVLCLPLTKETKGMIGQEELMALGRDSYLINVARGELVDEDSLAWALRKGAIAGAALDVLSIEPPSRRHPLRGCPNLLITPHIAGNIYTFRQEVKKRFVHNLRAFLDGTEMEGTYAIGG